MPLCTSHFAVSGMFFVLPPCSAFTCVAPSMGYLTCLSVLPGMSFSPGNLPDTLRACSMDHSLAAALSLYCKCVVFASLATLGTCQGQNMQYVHYSHNGDWHSECSSLNYLESCELCYLSMLDVFQNPSDTSIPRGPSPLYNTMWCSQAAVATVPNLMGPVSYRGTVCAKSSLTLRPHRL